MIVKQEIQELFHALWVVSHLGPAEAAALNARLKGEIEKIVAPRPGCRAAATASAQDLHTRPAFADFTMLVEKVARGVARYLEVEQFPMMVTGYGPISIRPAPTIRPTITRTTT